jgi:hypothetical protein
MSNRFSLKETSYQPPPPPSEEFEKSNGFKFLKTDVFLFVSPFLIALGWYIVGLNQSSMYTDISLQSSTIGYPYSLEGTIIMLTAEIFLSIGITYRWVRSISRGGLIVSQIIGWLATSLAILVLIFGSSNLWGTPTYTASSSTINNVLSIDPVVSGLAALIWFAGTATIASGLVPLRRWLNTNITSKQNH